MNTTPTNTTTKPAPLAMTIHTDTRATEDVRASWLVMEDRSRGFVNVNIGGVTLLLSKSTAEVLAQVLQEVTANV